MSDMVYAVHTRTCTYLLDEEGVCGWVLSPAGDTAQDRCIGAQFVACLDLSEHGGLVGELRVGACGLFARREGGRFVLLKTSNIEHVDFRRTPEQIDPRRSAADLSVTAALPDAHEALPDVHENDARLDAAWSDREQRAAAVPEASPETQRLPGERDPRHESSAPSYHAYRDAFPTAQDHIPSPYSAPPVAAPGGPDPYAAAAAHAYQRDRFDDPETGPIPQGYDGQPYAQGAGGPQHAGWPQEPPMVSAQVAASSEELDAVDLDELSTFSSEVTLTIPLYRPDPDDSPPRWGGGPSPAAWPSAARKRHG